MMADGIFHSEAGSETVKVVARVRPLNGLETSKGSAVAVQELGATQLSIEAEGTKYTFEFDKVFPVYASQEDVFNDVALPMVSGAQAGVSPAFLRYADSQSVLIEKRLLSKIPGIATHY